MDMTALWPLWCSKFLHRFPLKNHSWVSVGISPETALVSGRLSKKNCWWVKTFPKNCPQTQNSCSTEKVEHIYQQPFAVYYEVVVTFAYRERSVEFPRAPPNVLLSCSLLNTQPSPRLAGVSGHFLIQSSKQTSGFVSQEKKAQHLVTQTGPDPGSLSNWWIGLNW